MMRPHPMLFNEKKQVWADILIGVGPCSVAPVQERQWKAALAETNVAAIIESASEDARPKSRTNCKRMVTPSLCKNKISQIAKTCEELCRKLMRWSVSACLCKRIKTTSEIARACFALDIPIVHRSSRKVLHARDGVFVQTTTVIRLALILTRCLSRGFSLYWNIMLKCNRGFLDL